MRVVVRVTVPAYLDECPCRNEPGWVGQISDRARGDGAGNGGADRRRPLRWDTTLKRELLGALAAEDGDATAGCRLLEIQVVQQTGGVDHFVVDRCAVEGGECEPEQKVRYEC